MLFHHLLSFVYTYIAQRPLSREDVQQVKFQDQELRTSKKKI